MGFRLETVVDDVVGELSRTDRPIDVHLAEDLPSRVPGAPEALRDALTSLVAGAVRFTPSGDVSLQIERLAQVDGVLVLRCEVRDTSPSRADADCQRLEELFATASRCKGASYLLVDAPAGGSVGATRDPATGSRFWFTARLAA